MKSLGKILAERSEEERKDIHNLLNNFPILETEQVEEDIKEVLEAPQWVSGQWDAVDQLKSEVVGWREKHAKALLEIDKLRKLIKPEKEDHLYA